MPTRGFKNTPLLQRPVFTSLYWLLVAGKKSKVNETQQQQQISRLHPCFRYQTNLLLSVATLKKRIETGRIEFFGFFVSVGRTLSVSSKVQIHEKTDRPGKKHGLF